MFRLIMTNIKHLTFGKLFLLAAAAELFFGINGGLNVKADGFDVKYFIFTVLLCAAVTLSTWDGSIPTAPCATSSPWATPEGRYSSR